MSDTAKLIKIGDGWYHQVAIKCLNIKENKLYCLKKTDKNNVLELTEADIQVDGAGDLDLSHFLTKHEAENTYALKDDFEVAHNETHYGIRGDYCAHYGIVKIYDKIASYVTGTKRLTVHGGLTLDMPGKETLVYTASDITRTIESDEDCTIFFVDGELKEAQEVFWQVKAPIPTKSSAAWWNPEAKMWYFDDNNSGWSGVPSAQPLLDIFVTDGAIVRMSYAGYRLLDSEVPLTIDGEYSELATTSKTIIGAINEVSDVADIAEAIADAAQVKAFDGLTTTDKHIVGAINELDTKLGKETLTTQSKTITGALNELCSAHSSSAVMHGMVPTMTNSTATTLDELKDEYNALLAVLRGRGVIS